LVGAMINDYLTRLPADFVMMDLNGRIKERTPYVVVAIQECDRMNVLLTEIRISLTELQLGLQGALNITDAMENLSNSLFLNRVPGNWEKYAYFSKKPLAMWFADLLERIKQLTTWTEKFDLPKSLWISGLFNPMSFLTAIMQVTSRTFSYPLDNMVLQTNVTSFAVPDESMPAPKDGAYIHGLFLEGAAWEMGRGGAQGQLVDSKLKELHPLLPVVNVVAVKIEDKVKELQYACPMYVTSMRGPTFVTTANLKMDSEKDNSKWILAGVALLLSDD